MQWDSIHKYRGYRGDLLISTLYALSVHSLAAGNMGCWWLTAVMEHCLTKARAPTEGADVEIQWPSPLLSIWDNSEGSSAGEWLSHGTVVTSHIPYTDLWLTMWLAVVHLLSCVQFFATPWTVAHQAPLSSTISQSLLKFKVRLHFYKLQIYYGNHYLQDYYNKWLDKWSYHLIIQISVFQV